MPKLKSTFEKKENVLSKKLLSVTGLNKEAYLKKLKNIEKKRITEIDILISNYCDQDCIHCYIPKEVKQKISTKEEIEKLISLLSENNYFVLPQYTEVFLHKLNMDVFNRFSSDEVITNGNILSKLSYLKLKEKLKELNIKTIDLSLHVDKENHSLLTNRDNWDDLIKLAKNIQKLKYNLNIYAVVTKKSYPNIIKFVDFLVKNKIFSVTFIQYMSIENKYDLALSNNDFKKFVNNIEIIKSKYSKDIIKLQIRASMGPNFLSSSIYNLQLNENRYIDSTCRGGKGFCNAGEAFFVAVKDKKDVYNLYPCHALIRPELIVGKIDLNKNKITFNKKILDSLKPYREKQDGVCKNCFAWAYCRGGCLAMNYLNKNNNVYHNSYCYTKALIGNNHDK